MTEIPVITDSDGMFAWFMERGLAPTVDEVSRALGRVGRVAAVGLLIDLYVAGLLTAEAAAASVGSAWSDSEYPDRHLSTDEWRPLFELVGYAEDGRPAERPTQPLALWRGSVPERRADWSWTDNRRVAVDHADGERFRLPLCRVWRATVEPWRLLARHTTRDGHEYVVDTDALLIMED